MATLIYNKATKQIPKDAHIIIIGAMKCGTTALYNALIQHPRICACMLKEPEFFSERQSHGINARINAEQWGTSLDYSDLWRFRPGKHKFAIEASTGYTKYPFEPHTALNIKNYGLDPHFIYLVRDPYARIESQYNFMMPYPYFNPGEPITAMTCVALSNYFLQLEPYRKLFGTGKLTIIEFDDWVSDYRSVISLIFNRLGIDDFGIDPALVNKNETRFTRVEVGINTSRITRALLPSGKLRFKIGRALRQFSKPADRRRLDEQERAVIHDLLENDMKEFGRVYGFPVGKWGF